MYEGLVIEYLGGNCPVQAEGTIDGCRFYFRARGEYWSFEVWAPEVEKLLSGGLPTIAPVFLYRQDYEVGEQFAAGWMPEEEAMDFLRHGATLYLASLVNGPDVLTS